MELEYIVEYKVMSPLPSIISLIAAVCLRVAYLLLSLSLPRVLFSRTVVFNPAVVVTWTGVAYSSILLGRVRQNSCEINRTVWTTVPWNLL